MKKLLSMILIVATIVCMVPLCSFAEFENTHINSGDMIADIIAVARTQLGYCEGNNSSQMDGTYAGSGDYTKYGQWYGLCPAAWCAMFVSWCANQAGIPTSIIPKHASCDVGMNWFKNNGLWQYAPYYDGDSDNDYTPKAGDIIYFGFKSGSEYDSTHVGIVYEVDKALGKVRVLEGNSSAKVQTVSYTMTSAYILGYGTPNYSDDATPVSYEPGSYIITVSSLNVRKGPSSSEYERLGYVTKGTVVQITEVANDHWGLFEYNGQPGWISLLTDYCSRIYTIRYNSNGGFGSPDPTTKQQNIAFTLSTIIPTRTGYTFLGWATTADATKVEYAPGASFYANNDTTFYAVWKQNEAPKTFTVTYNANGGSGAPSSQTKTEKVPLTLSSVKPTRTGQVFLGWATSPTSNTIAYLPGASYTKDENLTLYAIWYEDVSSISISQEGKGKCESHRTPNGITTTIVADDGYCISQISVDGQALSIVSDTTSMSFDFNDGKTHTIKVTFLYDLVTSDKDFSDVKTSSWYYYAVQYCYVNRIMQGTSDTLFSPSSELNRGSFAVILANAYKFYNGDLESFDNNPFSDVKSTSYYANDVVWAYNMGYINGMSQGIYSPKSALTREQVALILYNASDKLGLDKSNIDHSACSSFSDGSSVSSWAKEAMNWALTNNIFSGSSGKIMPKSPCTRAQIAQIMYSIFR